MSEQTAYRAWCIFLLLAAGQGAWALVSLLGGRSAGGAIQLAPLSATRLAFAAGVLVLLLFFSILLLETRLWPARAQKRIGRLLAFFEHNQRRNRMLLLFACLFLLSSFTLTLIPEIEEPFTRVILERLWPLVAWLAGLSALAFGAIFLLWNFTAIRRSLAKQRVFWAVLFLLASMFALWHWIVLPFYPSVSIRTGWNRQGVPLVEMQLLAAWLAGITTLAISGWVIHRMSQPKPPRWLSGRSPDLAIILLIWLVAVIGWQSIPITPSWFVSEPLYPTFDYCPYSDARSYDMVAQDALAGGGLRFLNTPFVRRSMHGLYLLILTLIGGQDYERVIFLQIVVLACLPVMIYLLGRSLHSRVTGVIAAVLILLREANAIALADVITTAHVKLFMVDVFTAFLVTILVYLAVRWLQNPHPGSLLGLACGGVTGVTMLVRLETFALIFPILALLVIALPAGRRWRAWLQHSLIFAIGVILVVSPWVWRNWQRTGLLFIDSPSHRTSLIQQRFYPPTPTPAPTATATSTPTPVPVTTLTSTPTISLTTSVTPAPSGGSLSPGSFKPHQIGPANTPSPGTPAPGSESDDPAYSRKPGEFIRFTLIHYLNSQVQTVLIFPSTIRWLDSTIGFAAHHDLSRFWKECCSLTSYVRRMPYWHTWTGEFPRQAALPLAINLVILSAGIAIAWRERRWSGILPAALAATYLAGNAVFRNSGGRYVLPIDWTSILYFSAGLTHLTFSILEKVLGQPLAANTSPAFDPDAHRAAPPPGKLLRSPDFYGLVALLCLLGWSLPVAEKIIPDPYPPTRQKQMLTSLLYAPGLVDEQRKVLQAFVAQGALALPGRMICPQYYPSGGGAPSPNAGDLVVRPYPRLVFYLAGKWGRDWALPVAQKPPRLVSGDDAMIITCWRQDIPVLEPLAVGVFEPSGELKAVVVRSFLPDTTTCPQSAP